MDVDPGISSTTVEPFIVEQNKTFLMLYYMSPCKIPKFYSNCLRWWTGGCSAIVLRPQRHLLTSAVVYIAIYSELQSNGVNDGGTTESRGLHGWIGSASKFTMPFTLLEYVVRVANNILSKFSEFSIDYNTNLCKMAQECTPEVTSRQMKFLTALREKGHSCLLQRSWSCLQSTTVVSLVSLAS